MKLNSITAAVICAAATFIAPSAHADAYGVNADAEFIKAAGAHIETDHDLEIMIRMGHSVCDMSRQGNSDTQIIQGIAEWLRNGSTATSDQSFDTAGRIVYAARGAYCPN